MGSSFGDVNQPASGAGPVSSVVRNKLNHLKELMQVLFTWNADSSLCVVSPVILRNPGELIIWPGKYLPTGYSLADGIPRLRSAFPAVYLAYRDPDTGLDIWPGGNGTTTFGVPNVMSTLMMGAGQRAGFTNRVLGTYVGEEAHANTGPENGPHDHFIGGFTAGVGFSSVGTGGQPISSNPTSGVSGAGIPHNTIPPCAIFLVGFKT